MIDPDTMFLFILQHNRDDYIETVRTHPKMGLQFSLLAYDFDHPSNGRQAILAQVKVFMAQAGLSCPKTILSLEGERGLGKSHIASGVAQWLLLNKGLPFEWAYWPHYADSPFETPGEDELWGAPLLILEDVDSALSIAASTQNPWKLQKLLRIVKTRIEGHGNIQPKPTIVIWNRTLEEAEPALGRDTKAGAVEDAVRMARTLIDAVRGSAIRASFRGESYRSKLTLNWKQEAIAQARAVDPKSLGLAGEFGL